jgi:hypothetical protein
VGARLDPGLPGHPQVAGRRVQLNDRRRGRDAVGGGPVDHQSLGAEHDVLVREFPVLGRPPFQPQAGEAAPDKAPALVGRGAVVGAHDEGHARPQLRDWREPAAELEPRPGDEKQAGHREQPVPGDMLGVQRALGQPGQQDRPGVGRAQALQLGGELEQETGVVQVGLAVRRPGRVPRLPPAVGEHGGDPRRSPPLGQPGQPGQAAPVHAGSVQRDDQRRGRLPRPPGRPRQPVRPAHPRYIDLPALKLAAAACRHGQIVRSRGLLRDI